MKRAQYPRKRRMAFLSLFVAATLALSLSSLSALASEPEGTQNKAGSQADIPTLLGTASEGAPVPTGDQPDVSFVDHPTTLSGSEDEGLSLVAPDSESATLPESSGDSPLGTGASSTVIGNGETNAATSLNHIAPLSQLTITFYDTSGDGNLSSAEVQAHLAASGITPDDTFVAYIDQGVTTIGVGAFSGNTQIVGVSAPAVTTIGQASFSQCSNLQSLDFPSVVTISTEAFRGSGIASLDLPQNFPSLTLISGYSVFAYCQNLVTADLSSLSTIPDMGFMNCSSLETVDISGATKIIERAFMGCSSLKAVDLSSITSFGNWVFYDCSTLEDVTWPTIPAAYGRQVFEGCAIDFSPYILGQIPYPVGLDESFIRDKALSQTPRISFGMSPSSETIYTGEMYHDPTISLLTMNGNDIVSLVGDPALGFWLTYEETDLEISITGKPADTNTPGIYDIVYSTAPNLRAMPSSNTYVLTILPTAVIDDNGGTSVNKDNGTSANPGKMPRTTDELPLGIVIAAGAFVIASAGIALVGIRRMKQ